MGTVCCLPPLLGAIPSLSEVEQVVYQHGGMTGISRGKMRIIEEAYVW